MKRFFLGFRCLQGDLQFCSIVSLSALYLGDGWYTYVFNMQTKWTKRLNEKITE